MGEGERTRGERPAIKISGYGLEFTSPEIPPNVKSHTKGRLELS